MFGGIWRRILIALMVILSLAGVFFLLCGAWYFTILCIPLILLCRKLWSKSEEKNLIRQQQMAEFMAEEITKPTLTGAMLRHQLQEQEFESERTQRQIAEDLRSINNKLF